jgi:predicted 2-oxoglutarate/Fe(II)-dependent dioxygenase YbiX
MIALARAAYLRASLAPAPWLSGDRDRRKRHTNVRHAQALKDDADLLLG